MLRDLCVDLDPRGYVKVGTNRYATRLARSF
jgi:hypothetical protein